MFVIQSLHELTEVTKVKLCPAEFTFILSIDRQIEQASERAIEREREREIEREREMIVLCG